MGKKDLENNNSESLLDTSNENLELLARKEELIQEEKKIDFKNKLLERREKKLLEMERGIKELEEKYYMQIEEQMAEKLKFQEECYEKSNYIVEDVRKRNIELANEVNELSRVKFENEAIKVEVSQKGEEINRLRTEISDYKSKIQEFELVHNINEIRDIKEKLIVMNELEEENSNLKKEINLLRVLNQELQVENEEIETLKNMNEVLSNKLQRRISEIQYLKKIEKAKGTGEDGSQKVFEEIINSQLKLDKDNIPEQYRNDKEFIKNFILFCKNSGFIYDENLIRSFIACLRSSKLTILKGYSGTGKSSLPNLFAKFLKAECVVVPVQPNWRTKQDIIGFYNYFTNKFIPTELTQTLLKANVSKDRIFIIVLDEMNLARVEYYFSEFNSKIWLSKNERYIELFEGVGNYDGKVSNYIKDNKIQIPDNVYFVGTINEDDSVSPISDKIFDRAQVIDFMELPNSKLVGDLDKACEEVEGINYTTFNSFNRNYEKNKINVDIKVVDKVNELTKEYFNKVIGFRSLKQIQDFVSCYLEAGGKEIDAIDIQLVSKFIPKLKLVSSENDINLLEYLIEEIEILFKNNFSCDEKTIESLKIIKQLKTIIEEVVE